MQKTNNSLYSIQEKTILSYIDRMWKLLPIVFVIIFLIETALYFFVSGNSNVETDSHYINKSWTIIESYLPTVISFVAYFILYSLYKNKKSNFHMKKSYYQAILFISGSGYIFVHSGYPILIAIYVIPIITSCAFSKTAVLRSVKYSSCCILVYVIFQCIREQSTYYIPISIIMEMIVIFSTFIVLKINEQFHETFEKLTKALKESAELENKLHYDSLTSAYSREKLDNDLEEQKSFGIISVAFIDIDNFKKINDEYGHDTGDWVLSVFVKTTIEDGINIYRFGGDEFVITSYMTPRNLYDKLVYKTENFKYETKKQLGNSVSISCGIVHTNCFNHDTIKRADELMYSIKKTGKNLIKILD